ATRPPPVHRRRPEPRPIPYRLREPVPPPAVPYRPPMPAPPQPPVQTAAIPRPAPAPPAAAPPGPVVSAGYRAALGAWLESHKRYPESARERGEAGQAVLRFHVERSGRVLNYAVVRSTGYPDLDAAIEQMMRGATLPPFPADMSASDIEVSVTIRFALAR
ncbi:MAG: energy transducer TonB, partial [Thiohalocapsa sp.]